MLELPGEPWKTRPRGGDCVPLRRYSPTFNLPHEPSSLNALHWEAEEIRHQLSSTAFSQPQVHCGVGYGVSLTWSRKLPRTARELSAIEVSRLTAPGYVAVGVVPGLHLQVSSTGAKSWILRIMVGDKRRDMGLGGYPAVTLAQAREKARAARAAVDGGHDPVLNRQRALSSLRSAQALEKTFKWCAEQYIDSHSDTWRNQKHRQQWTATLTNYAYPLIGNMLVRDVAQSHILSVLEPIWRDKTETAKRLRGRLETVLDWATTRHYREGENPARWQGHLEMLLPAPSRIQKTEHHRALPVNAALPFMAELRKREGMAARALEFLMLTAARSGEVRGATWTEFDLDAKVWTVPASRMKAEKEHRVPLTAHTIKLLNALPRQAEDESPFVFFAPRGGKLSDMALTAVMRRMNADAVPHGMRSTFRDWVAECTDYPRDLAEHALAHTLESKVEAAYRRGDALEKRRGMMHSWGEFLGDAPVSPG